MKPTDTSIGPTIKYSAVTLSRFRHNESNESAEGATNGGSGHVVVRSGTVCEVVACDCGLVKAPLSATFRLATLVTMARRWGHLAVLGSRALVTFGWVAGIRPTLTSQGRLVHRAYSSTQVLL